MIGPRVLALLESRGLAGVQARGELLRLLLARQGGSMIACLLGTALALPCLVFLVHLAATRAAGLPAEHRASIVLATLACACFSGAFAWAFGRELLLDPVGLLLRRPQDCVFADGELRRAYAYGKSGVRIEGRFDDATSAKGGLLLEEVTSAAWHADAGSAPALPLRVRVVYARGGPPYGAVIGLEALRRRARRGDGSAFDAAGLLRGALVFIPLWFAGRAFWGWAAPLLPSWGRVLLFNLFIGLGLLALYAAAAFAQPARGESLRRRLAPVLNPVGVGVALLPFTLVACAILYALLIRRLPLLWGGSVWPADAMRAPALVLALPTALFLIVGGLRLLRRLRR